MMQLYSPFEARSYQEAVKAMRAVGRDCIMKRLRAHKNGEEVQMDILSQILQLACELIIIVSKPHVI